LSNTVAHTNILFTGKKSPRPFHTVKMSPLGDILPVCSRPPHEVSAYPAIIPPTP